MTRGLKILLIAPFAIAGMVLFTFIGGEVVKLLWNGLLPSLFGFPAVTFWQALGLLVLSRVLFGGFGHGFGRRHVSRWTPEERERFRQRIRERWRVRHPDSPIFNGPAAGGQ